MSQPYDLTQLDAHSFEHMTNFLALKVIGSGVTGFSPGADGGRDGFFTGEAIYPSNSERWSGVWYIQSKFHKPHLSKNPQSWLVSEVEKEIKQFTDPESSRTIPDNWIISTNIEPSGNPKTGAFDKIIEKAKQAFGKPINIDIWGGRRILDFLAAHPKAASYYGHFLTPGNVLSALYDQINDATAQVKDILDFLIVNQFNEQTYTKLEQAGSTSDSRPKIYQLFIDLPYRTTKGKEFEFILNDLVTSSSNNHRISAWSEFNNKWDEWSREPKRSRIIILKGGPGQGKSTIGQYFSQLQRAALLLSNDAPTVIHATKVIAQEFKSAAEKLGFWPTQPRIPITIELKDFARWHGAVTGGSKGVLSYIAEKITHRVEQKVLPGTLKRALETKSWFVNFDGLDEVPNDVKDSVAGEILKFTNELLPSIDADVLTLCTTRPQGYSGQFNSLDGVTIPLSSLPKEIALDCAATLVKFGRTHEESESSLKTLKAAMDSQQVRELMTTPLQSHIMAVVVRDGGRPPEKRWELFENFYQVMKKRESLKDFPDPRISKLLRENEQLLRSIHSRLGISLHSRAENSDGAETTLNRDEFRALSKQATSILMDENVESMVDALMEATMERLVFVNTPENSENVRFDIRQLQEFFAAEFIYSGASPSVLRERTELIYNDSHWREVMHFTLSALIVTNRTTELTVAIEVLHRAEEGMECPNLRLFNRRMAVGSILALRLLSEGVLEQDKRVRQKFSKVLEPLYGTCDPVTLSTISHIKHPNSLVWLTNCMIDNLLEYNETETIGSAISLAQLLPCDNQRTNLVSERIFSSTDNYINYTYRALSSLSGFEDILSNITRKTINIQPWFIRATILLITNPPKDKKIKIDLPLQLLSSHIIATLEILEELNLTKNEKQILTLFLEPETRHTERTDRKKDISYGGISLIYFEQNWQRQGIPEFLNIELTDYTGNSPLIKMGWALITFAQNKNRKNFIDLLSSMTALEDMPNFVPRRLMAFIPVNLFGEDGSDQICNFLTISEADFKILLDSGTYQGIRYNPHIEDLDFTEKFTTDGWIDFCRDYPAIALNLWAQPFNRVAEIKEDNISIYSAPILKILMSNPEHCATHILSLGQIFKAHPNEEKTIRNNLLQLRTKSNEPQRNISNFVTIAPFRINLPEEINLLPLLATALIQTIGDRHGAIKHQKTFNRYDQKLLKAFGIQPKQLQLIFKDKNAEVAHRAAALSCYISLPINYISIAKFFNKNIDKIFIEIAEQNPPSWFIQFITFFLNRETANIGEQTQEFLGRIFHIYRAQYNECEVIQELITDLRERSHAPMLKNSALERWLSYDLTPE